MGKNLATEIGAQLQAQQWLLATAESCTGGLIAANITDIAGSSAWFDCGFVTYSNAAKIEMLGVNIDTLNNHGAVSEAVAREMALGAIAHSQAHVSIATTGIAGPGGGSDAKPVGTVCFAWIINAAVNTITQHFIGDRASVRKQAVCYALQELSVLLNSSV